MVFVSQDSEGDDKTQFHEDEHELDPKRQPDDAKFTVMDSKSLVLPADENCRHDVAAADICQINAADLFVELT